VAILRKKVVVKKKMNENNWYTTGTVIPDAASINTVEALGSAKDTFSFTCLNANNKYYIFKFTGRWFYYYIFSNIRW